MEKVEIRCAILIGKVS